MNGTGEIANLRLVETQTKNVHKLVPGTKYLLASHSHLFPPSLETQSSSLPPPHPLLLPPPHIHNEQYCCQLEVNSDRCLLSVWVGECSVDRTKIAPHCSPIQLTNECLVQLGEHLVLQFIASSEGPRRRLLPRTPGQELNEAPPSKPTRTQSSLPLLEKMETTDNGDSSPLSIEAELDPGLRERLKRIAREVNSRDSKVGRSKPPPPYEQVGNSIGYQLLLQHHSNHGNVTTVMIDSLYPMLKYMQLKELSLEQFYKDYLEQYALARKAGATPTNMHPEDTPTIVFIVDTLIQLCSLPRVNELAVRYCPMWMRLLSVFCHTTQNQRAMANERLATKVVSCMGLGIMAEQVEFQIHGWNVLTQVVATPTLKAIKPALSEPAIALALPLAEQQLQNSGDHLPLVVAILGFLSHLAGTAKECQIGRAKDQEEEEEVYSQEQASRILRLLSERAILRHVMKVPQHVRRDATFDSHYCLLVKALVPTRKNIVKPSITPSSNSTSSLPVVPPAKPKRIRRAMTEGSLKGSRKSRHSRKHRAPAVGEAVQHSSAASLPGADLYQSLSEENLVQSTEGEEREDSEELKVVRSEGEESEEEGNAEKRLQEMQALATGQQSCSSSVTPLKPDRPDSLAVDIESVLAEVRQPVRQYSIKHDPGQPESYHHASLKKDLGTEDLKAEQTLGSGSDGESSDRAKNDSTLHQSTRPPVSVQSLGCHGRLSDMQETSQQ